MAKWRHDNLFSPPLRLISNIYLPGANYLIRLKEWNFLHKVNYTEQ